MVTSQARVAILHSLHPHTRVLSIYCNVQWQALHKWLTLSNLLMRPKCRNSCPGSPGLSCGQRRTLFFLTHTNSANLWKFRFYKRLFYACVNGRHQVTKIGNYEPGKNAIAKISRIRKFVVYSSVKSCIKAVACVQFFNFWVRLLFKCSIYLRAAYMQNPWKRSGKCKMKVKLDIAIVPNLFRM